MVQKTSSLYKEKIYATERSIQATVSFEILDVEAYQDATASVTGEAPISRLSQAINKMRDMSHKYATFERDYFKLDGSFHIPPHVNEGDSELGWWSDTISDANGIFSPQPALQFDFTNPHNSVGLTIAFDKKANEYATDFKIEVFNPSAQIVVSETITGNTSAMYYFDTLLENYQKIVITIIKWANPNKRARIVEVDFGVAVEYAGDKLISLKILEEMDLVGSTVPSNEMQFVLDNQDQAFNILNPNGIFRFLMLNQEMTAQFGLLIGEEIYEWIPMGKYYLSEWTVEEGTMTSTFIGRDIFTRLDVVEYTRLLQNTNLYDLAVDVLNEAMIEDYDLDANLKLISTVGFKEKLKAREALQMIAIAGNSVVWQGRNGFVNIKHFEELTFETGFMTFAGQEFASAITIPQVNIDYKYQTINFESAYEIPKITLGQQITHLIFKLPAGENATVDAKFMNPTISNGIGYEISNPLVTTPEHAEEIAEWMFKEYNLIAEYQANWRQNPALECGDIVSIEDNFGNKKRGRITKNEFNYIGYLQGITEAKGGI
jgi:hypothetical protein